MEDAGPKNDRVTDQLSRLENGRRKSFACIYMHIAAMRCGPSFSVAPPTTEQSGVS